MLSITLNAQTTISNSIFLAGGDSLERSFTSNIRSATITAPSATAQTWDFTFLTSSSTLLDSVRFASSGNNYANFPNSEIIVPIAGFGEGYVDVTNTKMEIIGGALNFFGQSFYSTFSNPQTLQTAPLNYNTTTNDTHTLTFGQNIDSIPGLRALVDSFTSTLPIPIRADSFRIRITGTTNLNVDAFGTINLPNTTHNVLRQKVVVKNQIKIELKAFIWIDITNQIAGQLPIPLNDTTFRYDFLVEGSKVPLVRCNMDGSGTTINNIEFKDNYVIGVTRIEDLKEFNVYPNPASNNINIETENIGLDNFNVTIVDAMGRVLLKRNNLTGNNNQISVSELPKGTFWMVISNQDGVMYARKTISVSK